MVTESQFVDDRFPLMTAVYKVVYERAPAETIIEFLQT